ncbi:hypothetical protein ACJX0J_031778 [Zea mays]
MQAVDTNVHLHTYVHHILISRRNIDTHQYIIEKNISKFNIYIKCAPSFISVDCQIQLYNIYYYFSVGMRTINILLAKKLLCYVEFINDAQPLMDKLFMHLGVNFFEVSNDKYMHVINIRLKIP